jgi:hypothetical protein
MENDFVGANVTAAGIGWVSDFGKIDLYVCFLNLQFRELFTLSHSIKHHTPQI